MPHKYDASTKYLVENRLADWLPLTGRKTTAELQVINADLATVTAAADSVLRVCEDPPWLLHLELQSGRDTNLLSNLPAHNIRGMEESATYQAIVEKGVLRGRQDDILQLGRRQLGEPSPDAERALRGIADPERLARLHYAILDVSNWDELLATP
jgi:hypothetical protein